MKVLARDDRDHGGGQEYLYIDCWYKMAKVQIPPKMILRMVRHSLFLSRFATTIQA